ncbi:MAG: diaminohydroxyphosphoribosylaminopyrimidine deaminase, partial [Gammaproteobacteria bacterium]
CEYKVFNDDAANTLLVTLQDDPPTHSERSACVQVLSVPADANGNPDLRALMHALHSRGCFAVFVEGGGITVSRFVDANLLDRMQIAVAPVFIGQGREGLRVAAQQSLDDCLRPSHRLFRMGADLLFDCNLRIPPLDDTNGLSDGRYRSAIATGADSVIDDLSEMACAAPLPVRML